VVTSGNHYVVIQVKRLQRAIAELVVGKRERVVLHPFHHKRWRHQKAFKLTRTVCKKGRRIQGRSEVSKFSIFLLCEPAPGYAIAEGTIIVSRLKAEG